MKFTPRSVNLASKGKWVTVRLEFSGDVTANDVDLSTLLFEGQLPADSAKVLASDQIQLKYSRSAVHELLEIGPSVEVAVSGELNNGTMFEATDHVKVMDKGKKNK